MTSRTARIEPPISVITSATYAKNGSNGLDSAVVRRGPKRPVPARGCSSDGRALQSHRRGQGFDQPRAKCLKHPAESAAERRPPKPAKRQSVTRMSPETENDDGFFQARLEVSSKT